MPGCHAVIVTRCDNRADFDVCPYYGYNAAGEPFDVCLCRGYSATAMSPFDGGEQQVTLQRDPTHAMQYAIQCSADRVANIRATLVGRQALQGQMPCV